MYYLGTGCPPQGRYTSLVTQIIRKDQLEKGKRELISLGLDYWLIREDESEKADWYDVHRALSDRIERDYVKIRRIGSFGLWRSRRIKEVEGGGPDGNNLWNILRQGLDLRRAGFRGGPHLTVGVDLREIAIQSTCRILHDFLQ